ncbi:transposase, partial [Serratia sp. Ag1]
NELRVYGDDALIATHLLAEKPAGWQTVAAHHRPLWQQTCRVAQRALSDYEELL